MAMGAGETGGTCPRVAGIGLESLGAIDCGDGGRIHPPTLTLYGFPRRTWKKRPKSEVHFFRCGCSAESESPKFPR